MVDRRAIELVDVLRSAPYLDLPDLAKAALPVLVSAFGLRAHGAVLHWVHAPTLRETMVAEPDDFSGAMRRDITAYHRYNQQQPLLRFCLTYPEATPVTLSECAPSRAVWERTNFFSHGADGMLVWTIRR